MEEPRYINHWSNAYLDLAATMLCKAVQIIQSDENRDDTADELGQAMLMGMDAIDEVLRIRKEREEATKVYLEGIPFEGVKQ